MRTCADTGWGKGGFMAVRVENNAVINNDTRINSMLHVRTTGNQFLPHLVYMCMDMLCKYKHAFTARLDPRVREEGALQAPAEAQSGDGQTFFRGRFISASKAFQLIKSCPPTSSRTISLT